MWHMSNLIKYICSGLKGFFWITSVKEVLKWLMIILYKQQRTTTSEADGQTAEL